MSKRSVTSWTLIILCLVHSYLGVADASENCIRAFSNLDELTTSLCDSIGLTVDQLKTEACPTDCQALYDDVLANCTVGDSYSGLLTSLKFEQITLFNQEGHKWTGCNLGYEPTLCERAFRYLDDIGNDYSSGPCRIDDLSADQLESDQCPQACQTFYDEIVTSCNVGDVYNANLPTSSLFLYAEDTLFVSEGTKWAGCNYGYSFTACQRSYSILGENENPCLVFDSLREEIASAPCPDQCQELFNDVLANCEPNVGIYLTPSATLGISSFGVYREAVLWSEYGRRQQCGVGYNPTSCDIAVRELSEDAPGILDLFFGPNSTVCESEDNGNACTPECIKRIDAVLSDCPVGAEFAPSGGYLSETHKRISFEGPQTLSSLGLDPTTLPTLSLSQPCWDYYITRSPPQSAFDGAVSTGGDKPTALPMQPDGASSSTHTRVPGAFVVASGMLILSSIIT